MHPEGTAEEIQRLQRCINDLVSILALPAIWTGQEPSQIANTLLDVLVRMLRLDFAYVGLSDSVGGSAAEFARSAEHRDIQPREIGRALEHWLAAEAPDPHPVLPNPVGDGLVSIACFRLGLQDEVGRFIVGSQRQGFPTPIERLLTQVAANEAAISLQEARHSRHERQVTEELEQRVVERTAQLASVNEQLAKVARVTTLGVLTASIAHEVNQPLSGIITNASTCLRMLDADPPNVEGARETARRTIRDGNRAADVIARLRTLFSKKEFTFEVLDLNEVTSEVIALSLRDLRRNQVALQSELADDLPTIVGDRIQLQQVILNLLRNASDAMVDVHDRPRQLLVRTEREDGDRVRVSVRDAGVGVDPRSMNKLFDAFYTTKSDGMGIGLSVSRSIIERHRGRLWTESNDGPGATFSFSIPSGPESAANEAPR